MFFPCRFNPLLPQPSPPPTFTLLLLQLYLTPMILPIGFAQFLCAVVFPCLVAALPVPCSVRLPVLAVPILPSWTYPIPAPLPVPAHLGQMSLPLLGLPQLLPITRWFRFLLAWPSPTLVSYGRPWFPTSSVNLPYLVPSTLTVPSRFRCGSGLFYFIGSKFIMTLYARHTTLPGEHGIQQPHSCCGSALLCALYTLPYWFPFTL